MNDPPGTHDAASNTTSKEGLRRVIGVWGLSANIVNIVVGAGIFVLPAIVAAGLGASSILAYAFCGLLIIVIMLCFAEVGSYVTRSGGAYSYIEVAFGKYPGFLASNLFIIGASVTSDAAVANALADGLKQLSPVFGDKFLRVAFFLIIFAGLAMINIRGVRQGINLVKFTTIAKLTPLLLLLLLGIPAITASNLAWTSTPTISQLGEVSLILFFAFQGAETGLNVSGEIRHPQRTVPRGILISVAGILLLYMMIQTVAQGVVGPSLGDYAEAPLAEVARRIIGPVGATVLVAGAAVSMFGNLSGEILNLPRIVFRAARDKVILPESLGRVHPRLATPYIAIIVYAAMGCTLAIVGEFKLLAILSSASMLLIYLGVALSVIKLRRTIERTPQSFVVPGGIAVPVIAIIIIVWLLSNLSGKELVSIVVFIAILTIIFGIMRLRR